MSLHDEAGTVIDQADGNLLCLIGHFNALTQQLEAARTDNAFTALCDQQRPLLDQICAARPLTYEVVVARLNMLSLFAPDLADEAETEGSWTMRMLAATLRDLPVRPPSNRAA